MTTTVADLVTARQGGALCLPPGPASTRFARLFSLETSEPMKIGTSLRFLFPAGPQTLTMYQAITAALPPGAFTDRPMGDDDVGRQAQNLIEVARAAQAANMWGLLVGDNHAIPPQYANMFQPVPTIARLSAETGSMMLGMVLLAPFYHPLLLAEQVGDVERVRRRAASSSRSPSGGSAHAFDRFGYRIGSRGPRSEEMIPVVRALLAGETSSPPPAGRSTSSTATISPLPRRRVEIWIAGTNDITVERAGRLGDGWLTAQNATDDVLVEQLELYRRTAGEHGRPCLPGAAPRRPRRRDRRGRREPTSNRSSSRATAGWTRRACWSASPDTVVGPAPLVRVDGLRRTSWSATSPATMRR